MNHFRTQRALMNQSTRHMADLLFFEMLRMMFLYNIYDTSSAVSDYAKNTIIRPMSTQFSSRDTELKAILYYFENLDYDQLQKKDAILMNKITVDTSNILKFTRKMMNGNDIKNQIPMFLKVLKKDLDISDPKLNAMYTVMNRWNSLTTKDMALLTKNIRNYGTLNLRHSELSKLVNSYYKNNKSFNNANDKKVNPMDVVLTAFSALAAKWSYDSRNKNKKSFDRLKGETKPMDSETKNKP